MMKATGKITLMALVAVALSAAAARPADIKELRARVVEVASKIEEATSRRINIVVMPEFKADACVFPDGTVVITSGLIEAADSDDELAFVIGHELAHVIGRDFGQAALPAIIRPDKLTRKLAREIAADMGGMYVAEKAGYNPYAAIRILTRIAPDFDTFFEHRIDVMTLYIKHVASPAAPLPEP
ncbi:MAG TPA: hypothetical protein ENJ37_00995 [Deltaproteobacteria bacterium]|nr:hypothetical protein [Deltaproteobacteria bacterium]